MTMDGLLNVYKPRGVTSRHVVDAVARAAGQRRVGHAGTLDPIAEGVLVLCLGQATRLVEFVQAMTKSYRGEFQFGLHSDTDDIEGETHRVVDAPIPDRTAVERQLATMVGEIRQRPPDYSAVKVKGRRAYRMARAGQRVELAPRRVRVESIDVITYEPPRLTVDIVCHGGTYIRAIGRDLASTLETTAVMTALTRTAIGTFRSQDAIPLEHLASRAAVESEMLPMRTAIAEMPTVQLSADEVARISQGRFVALAAMDAVESESVAALDGHARLRAILVRRGKEWGPRRVFRVDA